MFIGHFAVALAAKKVEPKGSLGVYFLACQLMDLLWPVLVLLGIEVVRVDLLATQVTPFDFVHYPYSHSLVASLLLSLGLGISLYFWKHSRTGDLTIILETLKETGPRGWLTFFFPLGTGLYHPPA